MPENQKPTLSEGAEDLLDLILMVNYGKNFSPFARQLSVIQDLWFGLNTGSKLDHHRTDKNFWLAFGELFRKELLNIDPEVTLAVPQEEAPSPAEQ